MSNLRKAISLALSGLVAGGFIALSAQAEQGSQHHPAAFSDFDADGSGYISENEFNTLRGQRMAARAAEGKQMKGAASAPAFADIDTDGDGQLNPEELAAAQKAHMEKRKSMGQGHGQGHGKHHGNGKGHGKGQNAHEGMQSKMPAFSDFDVDGDGQIVESEFNQGHAKRMSEMAAAGHQMKHAGDAPGFSGIDTNADGAISEDEFAAHQAVHHQQMHKGDTSSK